MTLASASKYAILGPLASGGMATVYLGRMTTGAGISRLVAIKRLHPHLAADDEFITLLLDEARLSAQIRHANVVSTLDVVKDRTGLGLIFEYIEGPALSLLLKARVGLGFPIPVAVAIAIGMLRGLDAAHEARSDTGEPLHVVHRDVSPHNVLVGVDGSARLIDFGVARARGQLAQSGAGETRGKIPYMAPEQVQFRPITKQVDVYGAGVVLWEMLAGRQLAPTVDDVDLLTERIIEGFREPPSAHRPEVNAALDAIVLRALSVDLARRYESAGEMADEIEKLAIAANPTEVGRFVRETAPEIIAARTQIVRSNTGAEPYRSLDEMMAELSKRIEHTQTLKAKAALQPAIVQIAAARTTEATPVPTEAPTVTPVTTRGPRRTLAWGVVSTVVVAGGVALALGTREPRGRSESNAPPPPTGAAPAPPAASSVAPVAPAPGLLVASEGPGGMSARPAETTPAKASQAPARRAGTKTPATSKPAASAAVTAEPPKVEKAASTPDPKDAVDPRSRW